MSQLIFHLFRAVSKTSQDVIHLVSSPPLPVDASDHFNFLSHCSAMRLLSVSATIYGIFVLNKLLCQASSWSLMIMMCPLHTFLPLHTPYCQSVLVLQGESAPMGRWLSDNYQWLLICLFPFFLPEGDPVLHQNISFHPCKGKQRCSPSKDFITHIIYPVLEFKMMSVSQSI